MRSYLQRAEVRLSTMHRIAVAFLSGAGLLLVLPLLLNDTIARLVNIVSGSSFSTVVYCAVPFAVTIVIPLWALYMLFRDLCLFYYTANIPTVLTTIHGTRRPFHPRFSLTAIPFSEYTFPEVKKEIRRIQFNTDLRFFLLPYQDKAQQWLTDAAATRDGRRVQLPDDHWLPTEGRNDDYGALRMAFGIAGAYNRDLLEEAAKSELSLIRHNLHLRRLVMRYMKALLILVWTSVVSIGSDAVQRAVEASGNGAAIRQLAVVSGGSLLWATFTPLIVTAPVKWIYDEFSQDIKDNIRDPQIVHFEHRVLAACLVSSVLSAASWSVLLMPELYPYGVGASMGWLAFAACVVPAWLFYVRCVKPLFERESQTPEAEA